MQELAAAILAQDEVAWNENTQRQQDYEVHEQTRSIVLLFADVEAWPEAKVGRKQGWDRLGAVAEPVMQEILNRHYAPGGRIIRAMAAKLLAGGRILPPRHSTPSFAAGPRIHLPTTTSRRSPPLTAAITAGRSRATAIFTPHGRLSIPLKITHGSRNTPKIVESAMSVFAANFAFQSVLSLPASSSSEFGK